MKIFGREFSWGRKDAGGASIETVLQRLAVMSQTASGVSVTPESCMQSPTVTAIIKAVSSRISTLPIKVVEVSESKGRANRKQLPKHPVANLLKAPNDWQDSNAFWLDTVSVLIRYGNAYFLKARGKTGPIRKLIPLHPSNMRVEQDENWNVRYIYSGGGVQTEYGPDEIMHIRGAGRNMLVGDSTVMDQREAIGLEIMAEKMGGQVFGNGAMPGLIFKFAQGAGDFKNAEARKTFVDQFQEAYQGADRYKAMLMPKGIEIEKDAPIDNEKAQYILTRQYQRSVIAAAFNVPPHMVGDLSKGTYNNVEQQSIDFVNNVILPYVRMIEAAMERSLLTVDDRAAGVVVRFDLNAALRGDFKSRQEGLNIQRNAGIINANEWREVEGLNPISEEDGGEMYWTKGQSGQGGDPNAQPGEPEPKPEETPAEDGDDPENVVRMRARDARNA